MMLILRRAEREDFPRIVEIVNQTETEPLSLEEFTRWADLSERTPPCLRMVAENADGITVGYSLVRYAPWLLNGVAFGRVYVDREFTGTGIGKVLLDSTEKQAQDWGYRQLQTIVREGHSDILAWVQRQGYTLIHHFFNSELELTTFNPEHFRSLVERAVERGYRFLSMADLPDLVAAKRLWWEVDMICSLDEPDKGDDFEPVPYDTYAPGVFDTAAFDPQGCYFAFKGDDVAAISGLGFPPERDQAWTQMTGVLPAYRAQGLATATKLLTLDYAIARGYRRVGTGNHSKNVPIVAINKKLGYQSLPGTFALNKVFR